MAILLPTNLTQDNPLYPTVYFSDIKGNAWATGSDGNQYGIPEAKRELGMIVYFSSSQDFKYYKGGTTSSGDWGTAANWEVLGSGGSLGSSNFTASFDNESTWTINHNLDYQYVLVQVYDDNYNQIIPEEITLIDSNTAQVTFNSGVTGKAVVTVGGATLDTTLPAGSDRQFQYNDGGAFGGSNRLTTNGSFITINDLNNTYTAFSTGDSEYYVNTNLFYNRYLQQPTIQGYITDKKYSGDILTVETSAAANVYDLVSLGGDGGGQGWEATVQTNASATRMLGILVNEGAGVLTEGYITVGVTGMSDVPIIDGTLTVGAPVYIKEGASSSPFLTTTLPTSGYVRILGHIIYDDAFNNFWLMRFRPDNYWTT